MSRTIAPLRSLSSIVSRRGLSRSNVVLPFGRFYSTEGTADSSSSVEELTKTIGELESSKVELEKRVTEAETKAKDAQKDMKYLQAEIQTLSRRVSEERAKASEFAISSFARDLISTSDILTQALKHVPKPIEQGSSLESLFNGVEMTQKAMYKVFSEHGVKPMELAKGSQFDPNLHEATFQIPPSVAGPKEGGGEWGPGEVVEIGKEGWMIGSRVLRPAQVGVTQIE